MIVTVSFTVDEEPDRDELRKSGFSSLRDYVAHMIDAEGLDAVVGDSEVRVVSVKPEAGKS